MMFNLYVEQNQWIVAAVLFGAALIALFCLTYRAMWRGREEEAQKESSVRITGIGSFFYWVLTFMPWVLILIILGSIAYTVAHLWAASATVPNW